MDKLCNFFGVLSGSPRAKASMLSRPRAAAHSVFGRPEPHSRKNLPIDGSCQNAVPWKAIVLVFPSGETPASPFSVRIKKPDFGLPLPRNTHRALSIVSVARMNSSNCNPLIANDVRHTSQEKIFSAVRLGHAPFSCSISMHPHCLWNTVFRVFASFS